MSEAAVATLAIPQLVTTIGPFPPPPGGGSGVPSFTLGMIQAFAGLYQAFGAPGASGQLLSIQSNTPLYAVYGQSFGGGSATSFGLPRLDDAVMVGAFPGRTGPGTLGMTWVIATSSGGPGQILPFAGTVMPFGGRFAPDGWIVADGSMFAITDYPELFGAIGNAFGGDGESTFALPNLVGAAPVGVGTAPGRPPVALGESVPGDVPGVGLNYLICTTQAVYPAKDGDGIPPGDAFLGQIVAYAGSTAPTNWAVCDGAQLPVGTYTALHDVIGTTYGGDGVGSFGVPNLAGRMISGRALLDR